MKKGLVLKMGGSLGDASLDAIVQSVRTALAASRPVVLVHGGGPRITQALQDEGIELPFVQGHRLTTVEAIATITRVLTKVNREITVMLKQHQIPAVSVGMDDAILKAEPIPGLERTARVVGVNLHRIEHFIHEGQVPVVPPIALQGALAFNTNADLAAAAVAGALKADRVIFLTDVPGIYENFAAKTLLLETTSSELSQLLDAGRFHSGMIPKVEAVLAALATGVENAFVVDGRNLDAVAWAAQSNLEQGWGESPLGTRIVRKEVLI